MVTKYPFDRPKKVIDNEKKRITKPLTPQSGFVVRDLSVIIMLIYCEFLRKFCRLLQQPVGLRKYLRVQIGRAADIVTGANGYALKAEISFMLRKCKAFLVF